MRNCGLSKLRRRDFALPEGLKLDIRTPSWIGNTEVADESSDPFVKSLAKIKYIPATIKQEYEDKRVREKEGRHLSEKGGLPLAGALRQIGKKPFEHDDVKVYMNDRVKVFMQSIRDRFSDDQLNSLSPWLFILNMILMGILGNIVSKHYGLHFNLAWVSWAEPIFGMIVAVCLIEGFPDELTTKIESTRFAVLFAGVGILIICTLVFSILGPILILIGMFFSVYANNWNCATLEIYTEDIPRKVLDTILRISNICPDTSFYVEYLRETGDSFFLVAQRDDEQYYIDAWREARLDAEPVA